LPWSDAER